MKFRYLFIDDNIDDFLIAKRIFSKQSELAEELEYYSSAAQVLREIKENALEQSQFFFIFLDLNMPVMSGFEFLNHIDEMDFENIFNVIIMLGTELDKEKRSELKGFRFVTDIIEKPISKEIVERIIKKNETRKSFL